MEVQLLSQFEWKGPKSIPVHQHCFHVVLSGRFQRSPLACLSFLFIHSWNRSFIPCVCWRRRRSVVAPAVWQRRPMTSCWGRWRCWRWRIPTCDRSCRTTPTTWPSWRRRRPTWRLVLTPCTPPTSYTLYRLIKTKQPISNCVKTWGLCQFWENENRNVFVLSWSGFKNKCWVQPIPATKDCNKKLHTLYIYTMCMQNWRDIFRNSLFLLFLWFSTAKN